MIGGNNGAKLNVRWALVHVFSGVAPFLSTLKFLFSIIKVEHSSKSKTYEYLNYYYCSYKHEEIVYSQNV